MKNNGSETSAYLDHNATTPLLPEVREAMLEAMGAFGNPSSPHREGRDARTLLETSRKRIARQLGVSAQELLFTSGGSESNNTAIRQILQHPEPRHLVTSSIEHPSVLEAVRDLKAHAGVQVHLLRVDEHGVVLAEELREVLSPDTRLVSVMAANNETGALQPVSDLAQLCRSQQILFHTDATQVLGKQALDLAPFDYATATAHKLGGPRGIGLLYIRQGTPLHPLLFGGKQERVRRAGTESVLLACGFAQAVEWYTTHQEALARKHQELSRELWSRLGRLPGFFRNSPPEKSGLPHVLNFGFEGLSAETLVIALDLEGVSISTGSACSSGALEASPVLLAQGRSREQAKASLRVSLGWNTTTSEVERLSNRLEHHVHRLYRKKQCRS
ncbi:MAG: cysteine desulfurase family protein [bacterium]|jgi:cysteine desulfurase